MESGETEAGSDSNYPARRAVPPPLPSGSTHAPSPSLLPLSYRAVTPAGWAVVGSYRSAADWHVANKALSRRGIAAQMRAVSGDEVGYDLLVLRTEAAWACDLLSRSKISNDQMQPPTHGFPLDDPPPIRLDDDASRRNPTSMSNQPATPPPVSAIPPGGHGLSDRQQTTYTVWIILLWMLMGAVVLVFGLCFIFASN
jgi:hypothetical protein